MSENGHLYETRNVAREFSKGPLHVRAVNGVSITIDAGEFVALEGPSGSGKTTLLQLLGALDRPTGGEVLFEGRDLGRLPDGELAELRLRAFGFVFQQFNLNLDSKTGADVIDLLAGLAAQHDATVIVATHDAELASRAPRRLAMRDGALAVATVS